ncbi:MAG: penicillin-binding protein [Clostridia bacterium]|nr:penicillin-binding protein [Clostridia bacterium]
MRRKKGKNKDDQEPKAVKKMKNEKRKKQHKKEIVKEKTKKKKKLKRILIIILIFIVLILGISLGISAHTWKMLAKDMILNENSMVKDIDGNTIATLGSEKKKKTVTAKEIPMNLKNAYVAIEDERFYSHNGVDIKRTASAIGSYILHFGSSSFGGSTITQQLVKNLTGDTTDSITRKVKEWWKAWQLETCLSKEEILEGYLNVIYVGPNIYGIGAGAKYYFNKPVNDLSLEECAFLAGINHSPNSYNPFTEQDNREKIEKRTKIVLAKMKELGYLSSEEEYNQAITNVEKGFRFKKGEIESSDGVYSYHTDVLIPEITKDLCDKYNISETFATNYIYMAGLTIYSTQDSNIQSETEKEFEKKKYSLASKNGGDSSQAAMVIIDHRTGYVVASTGGLGKKTIARPFNRATQSVRQTGSAIKPIAVLAPAIDKKMITASTIVDDTEKDFEKNYHPTDYSSSLGKITVRRAVESSQNIPFVEIMEELKPKNAIKYLEKMGVTTLTDKDNSLPLSLRRTRKRN